MCIGVTVVCLPPSVLISGYMLWYQGEQLVLSNHYNRYIMEEDVPDQTKTSFVAGLATLGGTYYALSLVFPFVEGGTRVAQELKEHAVSRDHFNPTDKGFTVYDNIQKGGPGRYAPPKDMLELARRVAPPITLRLAASSVAFFCAGVAQTYIALKQRPPGRLYR